MNNPFHPFNPPKLDCELVPSPLWYNNLRKMLTKSRWDAIRKACYIRAGHTCEICGNLRGKPPEAHEIWSYDDRSLVQKLEGVISLCFKCHRVKHIGQAMTQGPYQFKSAFAHMAEVNEWPPELAAEYVQRQFQIHQIRSRQEWAQDLHWLDNAQSYIDDAEAYARDNRSELQQRTLDAMRSHDAKR